MAYDIGFVDDTGSEGIAHKQMLLKIKTFAEAHGWTTMRYDNTSAKRELILKGVGYSGTEEIYIGFRTYEDVTANYYNLSVATFTGYVSSSTFATQPGASPVLGVPGHESRIDYWLVVTPQSISGAMKVGTPVYETFSVGKFFPFGRPAQFPQPLIACGMFNGEAATRFSDPAHSFGYKGSRANFKMRFVDGVWKSPDISPWENGGSNLSDHVRPLANYELIPLVMYDNTPNVYGQVEGIWQITGFGNSVESVVQVGGSSTVDPTGLTLKQTVDAIIAVSGRAFVVIQDVSRTGFGDYIAMEMK